MREGSIFIFIQLPVRTIVLSPPSNYSGIYLYTKLMACTSRLFASFGSKEAHGELYMFLLCTMNVSVL